MTIAITRQMGDTDGLPMGERRAAIGTVAIASAISVLSTAVARIALPARVRELRAMPA